MKYNPHRVDDGKKSDWEGKSYAQMNRWQRRAYDTNGIDTPGNRITFGRLLLGGASLAAIKLGYKKTGLFGLALALGGDWLDGDVANKTETKMKRNGNFDAIADMAMRAGTLVVLASEDMIDKRYAQRLFALNSTIAATTVANGLLGHEPHSSIAGKAKTVAEGVSVVAGGINRVTETPHPIMERIETSTKIAALVGNSIAEAGYLHELFRPRGLQETPTITAAEQ